MNFDTLYKNRPYLFEIEKDIFEDNNEVLNKILQDAGFGFPEKTQFISSNYEYDLYRVLVNNKIMCVKYSFDPENSSLKHEYETLKKLNSPKTPKALKYNKIKFGDLIHYSILSMYSGETVNNFGLACLSENRDQFLSDFSSLQKNMFPDRDFDEYLYKILSSNNLNSFSEESIEGIEENSNLKVVKEIIKELSQEILSLSSLSLFREEHFCHGNLKPSNILFRGNEFNFLDFGSAFCGNSLLDLASLSINVGLNKKMDKQLFDLFVGDNKEKWPQYRSCCEMMYRKIFLESFVSYLKEVYMFSSFRPKKILEIADLFSKNSQQFGAIPCVSKNYEFIYKTMLEPIIGRDTA